MPFLLLLFAGTMLPLVMLCRAVLEAGIRLLESRPVKAMENFFSNTPGRRPPKHNLRLIHGNPQAVPERSRLN